MSSISKEFVTTAQVSQALGVSVTTVKRWVDDAILPAHKTAGGHRRLLLSDVLELVRSGQLPQADLNALIPRSHTDPEELLGEFRKAADEQNDDAIRRILQRGVQAGLSIPTIADRVLAPGLAYVGQRWAEGTLDVMHEHRITQVCLGVLYELDNAMTKSLRRPLPVAVGGAPENDHSVMPSLLAKLSLVETGWDAVNLGPHTPFTALQAALQEYSPRLIWVTASHIPDAVLFEEEYCALFEAARKRGTAVAIGGSGITEGLRRKLPYTTFGDGLTHLAAFAQSLHPQPPKPRRGRPPGS